MNEIMHMLIEKIINNKKKKMQSKNVKDSRQIVILKGIMSPSVNSNPRLECDILRIILGEKSLLGLE